MNIGENIVFMVNIEGNVQSHLRLQSLLLVNSRQPEFNILIVYSIQISVPLSHAAIDDILRQT